MRSKHQCRLTRCSSVSGRSAPQYRHADSESWVGIEQMKVRRKPVVPDEHLRIARDRLKMSRSPVKRSGSGEAPAAYIAGRCVGEYTVKRIGFSRTSVVPTTGRLKARGRWDPVGSQVQGVERVPPQAPRRTVLTPLRPSFFPWPPPYMVMVDGEVICLILSLYRLRVEARVRLLILRVDGAFGNWLSLFIDPDHP